MSKPLRICAYYSQGPHYTRLLAKLRDEYPQAHITAMVPPDYPEADELNTCADAVLETELPHYSPRDLGACRRLLAKIRSQHFDLFAIMFDSPQLRILAALSRIGRCCHGTMDGRIVPVRTSIVMTLGGIALRHVWGRLVYTAVWLAVHLLPVRQSAE